MSVPTISRENGFPEVHDFPPMSPGLSGQRRDDDRDPLSWLRLRTVLRFEPSELVSRVLEDLLDLLDRVAAVRDPVEVEPTDLPLHGSVRLNRHHRLVDHAFQHPQDRETVRDLVRIF